MSKGRSRASRRQRFASHLNLYRVVDQHTGHRVEVAPPIFYQLIRRGWAESLRDGRTARLVARLALRGEKVTDAGNLQLMAQREAIGPSIPSWWRICDRAWMYAVDGPTPTLAARQAALEAEFRFWGVGEPQPLVIGASL